MELKNVITKLKDTLQKFNSRLDEPEERISDWDPGTQTEQQEKKKWSYLMGAMGQHQVNNVLIIGLPEGEERERDRKLI